jgi:hypothetical protein
MVATAGTLFVLLGLTLIPGLLVGTCAGLRGWVLLGSAPALTFGVVALGGPLVPVLLGRWSPWTAALCLAVVCVAVLAVRLVSRRWFGRLHLETGVTTPWRPVHHVGVAAALLVTAVVGLYVTRNATGGFNGVHQFWDAVFHANGVRYIADTGQSAPNALRAVNDPNNADFFYPNGYHVLLATAVQVTGITVVQAINMLAGLLTGLFGLGMVGVLRAMNSRPALVGSVAVLAGAFTTYPYALEFFGPVWPFATGIAVIPAFLALFVETLNVRHPSLVLTSALGMVGLVTLHPSVALSTAILGFFCVLQRWISARKVPLAEFVALAVMGALASINAVPQLLGAVGTATISAVDWPLYANPGSALGQLFFLNFETALPQWWLVAAIALGVVGLRRLRELTWWLLGGLVFVLLFVMTTSYKGPLVALLTGPWWNDRWRFAALCTLPLLVVAGNGLVVARDSVLMVVKRFAARGDLPLRLASSTAVVLVLALLTNGLYWSRNIQFVSPAYRPQNQTMTPAKQAAIAQLRKLVPGDDLVMNDPADGSAWMWALEDVRPVFGHVVTGTPDEKGVGKDRLMLYQRFDELDTNEDVRRATQRLKITYVFESDEKVYGSSSHAPGLDQLDNVRSLQLVYSHGGSRIYRVDLTALSG